MARSSMRGLPVDRRIRLADGRTLSFVEVGAKDGYPVISNHGGLSCRLDVVPSDVAAKARGLRIISPDRPGIGQSDRDDGRTMLGWADDVRELVNRLEIDRFAVMGWSFGGCFAQAVARMLADRVTGLVLVASGIPRDWEGMRERINRMDRTFMRMSERAGGQIAERMILRPMGTTAHLLPRLTARAAGCRGPSAPMLGEAIAEGLTDTKGVVTEYRILNAPWGFDPSDIRVPTRLWQGDADDLVPPEWAMRLEVAIPDATLTLLPGANHFLWYEHWDEIFDQIAGPPH